jgi:putative tricarboxylic transport membrane protein
LAWARDRTQMEVVLYSAANQDQKEIAMPASNRLLRVGFPLAILALCAFLWSHIARKGVLLDNVPNAVGPGGWPRAMIVGLAIFAALTLIAELLDWRHNVRTGSEGVLKQTEDRRSQVLSLIGIVLILAYGFAIPYIGFAIATALFLAIWCALGRVRSVITIATVSLIGTTVLLYMFVALAKMPLNRGIEPFNNATISLYRLLRIY